jgi:hypothetical protein
MLPGKITVFSLSGAVLLLQITSFYAKESHLADLGKVLSIYAGIFAEVNQKSGT